MINHLYWSAISTVDGNEKEIREKWMSVDNHIHNIHRGGGGGGGGGGHGDIFKKCEHPPLKGRRNNKKWFKPRKYTLAVNT